MPRRAPEHMDAQRERILRATLHCISELGIEGTSIAAIRREAGLSAGALYVHFGNKEAIVAAALRFGSVKATYLPDTWPEFAAAIASLDDHGFLDSTLVARTQLQVFATAIRPGPQHDMVKPLVADAVALIADHLALLEAQGQIRLRMTPEQTALAMGAIKDGMIWTGLALDRSRAEVEAGIAAALDCLVCRRD